MSPVLKDHSAFQRVYRHGKSAHSVTMTLFYLPCEGETHVGYTASKKVGSAVVRNRCKRRLRALFAHYAPQLDQGWYVLVAKEALFHKDFHEILRDGRYVFKRVSALRYS